MAGANAMLCLSRDPPLADETATSVVATASRWSSVWIASGRHDQETLIASKRVHDNTTHLARSNAIPAAARAH